MQTRQTKTALPREYQVKLNDVKVMTHWQGHPERGRKIPGVPKKLFYGPRIRLVWKKKADSTKGEVELNGVVYGKPPAEWVDRHVSLERVSVKPDPKGNSMWFVDCEPEWFPLIKMWLLNNCL